MTCASIGYNCKRSDKRRAVIFQQQPVAVRFSSRNNPILSPFSTPTIPFFSVPSFRGNQRGACFSLETIPRYNQTATFQPRDIAQQRRSEARQLTRVVQLPRASYGINVPQGNFFADQQAG